MAFPSAGLLGQLRTLAEQTFTSTATVFRKSAMSDGAGGQNDTYTAVGTYPCLFTRYPTRPFERERGPGIQTLIEWVFLFALDVEVQQTDRIDCESRHFEVVGQGIGSVDVVRRVICLEIL